MMDAVSIEKAILNGRTNYMENISSILSVSVEGRNFKWPEYVYRKLVEQPVPTVCYAGMSLEEIKKHHGKEAARRVYETAVITGKDLNEVEKVSLETEPFVDLRIKQTKMVHGGFFEGSKIDIFCSANHLTYAKEDRLIRTVEFYHEEPSIEALHEIVIQALHSVTDRR